jgi:H+/gluconate symporter-like permease
MLALEHLHANALLVVLLGGALAIVSLRAAVYLLHRSLVATDRKIISSLARSEARQPARQSSELPQTYQDTPSAHDSKS